MVYRRARAGVRDGGASNLQAGEIFKIDRGGQIVGVGAIGAQLPYGTLRG